MSNVAKKRRLFTMKRNQFLAVKNKKSSGMGVWSIVGGIALVAVAAGVVMSLPDIKRYMKIRNM